MEGTKFKWQWIGIITQFPDNIPDLIKNTQYPNKQIVLKESNIWHDDYNLCQEHAHQNNDIDIPDSWGLELTIISKCM